MGMTGRPSTYTEELGDAICEALANTDKGLRHVLKEIEGAPSFACVHQWRHDHASFADKFAQAKKRQIENMAEDIVDHTMDESLDPNVRRLIVDTKKWLLAKLLPRTYGDKLDITSGNEALATPSHLIDARVQSIIMQAHARRLGEQAAPVLDANALKLLD
jgi:hypothetical protein